MLGRIALLQEGLNQVSDNIAHDLKTPLTRLRNRAEAALAEAGGDPKAALEANIAEADGMIRTFDALLMISRVEAGFHPAMKETVDLAAIARDVVELYEPLAEETDARIEAHAPQPIMARVSRELISQAISNLIDNALKYAAPADDTSVLVRVEAQATDAGRRIVVSDNGGGIPPDKRARVLERFYRLDASRSKPGTGLGLSLVQAIARLHGGRVRLEDAGPGLRVVLELPASDGEDRDERSAAAGLA